MKLRHLHILREFLLGMNKLKRCMHQFYVFKFRPVNFFLVLLFVLVDLYQSLKNIVIRVMYNVF